MNTLHMILVGLATVLLWGSPALIFIGVFLYSVRLRGNYPSEAIKQERLANASRLIGLGALGALLSLGLGYLAVFVFQAPHP